MSSAFALKIPPSPPAPPSQMFAVPANHYQTSASVVGISAMSVSTPLVPSAAYIPTPMSRTGGLNTKLRTQ